MKPGFFCLMISGSFGLRDLQHPVQVGGKNWDFNILLDILFSIAFLNLKMDTHTLL